MTKILIGDEVMTESGGVPNGYFGPAVSAKIIVDDEVFQASGGQSQASVQPYHEPYLSELHMRFRSRLHRLIERLRGFAFR